MTMRSTGATWDKAGRATARMRAPADERERERRAEIQADAAAYLVRTGYADLLPVLGLPAPDGDTPVPPPPVRDAVVTALVLGQRPADATPDEWDAAIDLVDQGRTLREVAALLEVSLRRVARRRAARRAEAGESGE